MNQFLKGMIWVCLGVVPFLAWLVADSMFFPFITGKNFLFRVLVEVALACWALLCLRDASYRTRGSLLVYVYTAFMISIGISDYLGVDGYVSFWSNYERMEGYITHLHLFAYFLVLYSFVKDDKSWNRVMGLFVAANVPVLVEGFMQLLGRPEFFFGKSFMPYINTLLHKTTLVGTLTGPTTQQIFHDVYSVHMSDSLRLDSSLGNAAYYGIYTLFNFIFAIVLIIKADKYKTKLRDSIKSSKLLLDNLKFTFKGSLNLLAIISSALLLLSSVLINYFAQTLGNTSLSTVSTVVYAAGLLCVLVSAYYFAKGYINGNIGRGVLAVIAIMNLIQLYYTQTRGSYLGLIGGLIAAAIFMITFKLKRKLDRKLDNRLMSIFATALILISITLIAVFAMYGGAKYISSHKDSNLVKNNVVLNRLATINIINPVQGLRMVQDESNNYEELNKYFGDITITSRFLNAKIAIDGLRSRPLFGYGQENYKNIFDTHFDPRMYTQEAWFDRTHDVFFDWLVAGGTVGLILYLSLYLTPFYIMWMGRSRARFNLLEKSAISGLLIAYFIHNIFVFDNLISYILFFMILAYVSGRSLSEVKDIKHIRISENTTIAVSIIICLLLVIGLYKVNWGPYATNMAISKGLQDKQITQMIANNGGDPTVGVKEINKVLSYAVANNDFGKQEALEQFVSSASGILSIQAQKPEYTTALNEQKMQLINSAFAGMDAFSASTTLPARSLTIFAGAIAELRAYDKALVVLDKALIQAPKKQILLNFRSQLLSMLGRKDEAYQTAKKSYMLETTFGTSESLYYAAAGEAKMGKDLETTIKNIQGVSVLPYSEKLLAVYVQSKMYKEATDILNQAKKSATSTTDKARLLQLEKEMYKSMSVK